VKTRLLALIAGCTLVCAHALAGGARIEGARAWAAPDSTRVVIDVSAPVEHRLSVLRDPERVVVDISGVSAPTAFDHLNVANAVFDRVRSAPREQDTLRVVFDLNARVRPKSFLLKPNERYGHRLVIDLFREDAANAASAPASADAPNTTQLRDVIVAVDAGHGGEDPGAIGPDGTREKDVVLAIARRLHDKVAQEPGMRPLMIRGGDYFVSLGGRKRAAQTQKADLFVSVHADSAGKNPRARGASVFAVSVQGASSEAARLLADSENAADLIGGVNLEETDDMLTTVLLDLTQTGTIEASLDLGGRVLGELGKVGNVHKGQVEQAGFAVLKSLGIPSILVESGFISNRAEEYKLRDPLYQELIANSVMRGIRSYFADHAPPGTRLAATNVQHVTQSGETLSSIAQRYQVSVGALRSLNELSGDLVEAGRILRIPRLN
jgi:N-acetylmuramoyl-L-alanine amidase